eukprot:Skav222774  [mRNA]  locus=scaffold600:399687:405058:- [translate_table: standard]
MQRPSHVTFKLGILNPTAVTSKLQALVDLACDILCLSETSATVTAQLYATNQLKAKGYNSLWTKPVKPHFTHMQDDAAMRGMASGVSLHTTWCARPSRVPLPSQIDPTRLLSSIVQVCQWHLHVITVYGYPASHHQSKQRTNALLEAALILEAEVGLPAVICGDLNHPPDSLDAGKVLLNMGYLTTAQMHHALHGCLMPPTCRDITCNDQAFVRPQLAPHVVAIEVNKEKLWNDHDPVLIQMNLPVAPQPVYTWKLPHSWIAYEPDASLVAKHFESAYDPLLVDLHTSDSSFDRLRAWSVACETAVDGALREQHHTEPQRFPQKRLPKKCRGRCIERKLVCTKLPQPVKHACQGQYNPPLERASYRVIHWTKQTRRVQSLCHRLRRVQDQQLLVEQYDQLQGEWHSICQAKGFGHFPSWCAHTPELGYCPMMLPALDYLELLSQLLRFHTDAIANQERHQRRSNAKFHKYYDQHQGHLARTVASIKGNPHPALTEVICQERRQATLLLQDSGYGELRVEDTAGLHSNQRAMYDVHPCTILSVDCTEVRLMLEDADVTLPPTGELQQARSCMDGVSIFQALHDYWTGFWCRDSFQDLETTDNWEDFCASLEHVPQLPQIEVDIRSTAHWESAIRQTKSGTARGYDAWYADELKLLPHVCIDALASLFASLPPVSVIPPALNKALTLPLSKKPDSRSADATRPITLLPLVYRLWARVVCCQVLTAWSATMPAAIIGYLPLRSPQQFLLKLQHEFELYHNRSGEHGPVWQGATLDLVKCYNLLPRLPGKLALAKAGLPESLIQQWFHTLNQVERWWKIHGSYYSSGKVTTGAPEGDSWSVMLCVAISRIWALQMATGTTVPSAYADNWGWKCQHLEDNLQAFNTTKLFVSSLRLRIDWSKTWVWSSAREDTAAWTEAIAAACPTENPVQRVQCARELGFVLNYNKRHSRQPQKARHDDALAFIHKARQYDLHLNSRAKLCQWALTKALWGTETYVVGASWLTALRSAVAKTLVMEKSHSNSYIACTLLSKHVQDPELMVIWQSIRACRNLLMSQPQIVRDQFCRHAARHSRRHFEVWGPAGALSYNLARIGWSLLADGTIDTDTSVQFHLLWDSQTCIRRYLDHAWTKHMTQTCLQRPEWTQLPVPDRRRTITILDKSEHLNRRVLAQAITGASMLASQLTHFTDRDPFCALCGEPDTHHHRLFACSSTADVRLRFPELIAHAEERHSCHVDLPVLFLPPDVDFATWYYQQRPAPVMSDQAMHLLEQLATATPEVQFYTDGSCLRPESLLFRRAGFSVVVQQHITDAEKQVAIQQYVQDKTLPDAFQVLLLGEVKGTQNIARAELTAMCEVAELPCGACVHTDSTYALNLLTQVKQESCVERLHALPNFDLIMRLWTHARRSDFRAAKVKAHDLQVATDPWPLTWQKLGNEAADLAASTFVKHIDRQLPVYTEETQQDYQDDAYWYPIWLQYLHDLQIARAQMFQQQPEAAVTGSARLPWEQQIRVLQQWSPPTGYHISCSDQDISILHRSIWGIQYSVSILEWLALLRWPATDQDADPLQAGVSWYELAISFLWCTQRGIMINTGGQGKHFAPSLVDLNNPDVEWNLQALKRQVIRIEAEKSGAAAAGAKQKDEER